MLNINKDDKSVPPKTILSGVIDETAVFLPLTDGNPRSLFLYCQNISRINSVGVKLWREFFSKYRSAGGTLTFYELSPALVATSNYLKDFILKSEVQSLCIPFQCEDCGKLTTLVTTLAELQKVNHSPTAPVCSNCGGTTDMDEIPDEYFSFLKK